MPAKFHDDDLVMSLVDLALACHVDQREAYLRSACEDDPELFDQVWKYVQWDQRMNGFLLEPLYPPASNEHPFDPGELLDGRFRIVREVAQGGMGVVYEAMDEKLERRIALKCAKTGFRKRLPPEVRNATEISHPNVCKLFEIHTASTNQGEIDFLTMEFLDGETLAARLTGGPLPEKDARAIALQLCAGLAEAHRNQVIHGDLKSNNVILTTGPNGAIRAVITDFGLARRPEATQATAPSGQMAGTPDYMAPELWKGGKASVASDIYALGVIISQLGSSWPQSRTVARCLDPDPLRRFRDADEVAQALSPAISRPSLPARHLPLAFAPAAFPWHFPPAVFPLVRAAVSPDVSAEEDRTAVVRIRHPRSTPRINIKDRWPPCSLKPKARRTPPRSSSCRDVRSWDSRPPTSLPP